MTRPARSRRTTPIRPSRDSISLASERRPSTLRTARLWIPLRRVWFALEVSAREVLLAKVFRIVDGRQHGQPVAAVRGEPIEILGDARVLAVRDAVLSEVAFAQIGRDDFERPRSRRRLLQADAEATRLRDLFPFGRRESLPGSFRRGPFGFAELKQPRLLTGIHLNLQRVVVLPGNLQP